MRMSTKSRYGLRAMLYLALLYDKGPVSVQSISNKEDIPLAYIEQLLSRLRKAGLVNSVRGPSGGYRLSGKPSDITVFDIVKVLEKDVAPVYCVSTDQAQSGKKCSKSSRCVTRLVWKKLAENIHDTLDSISLEDLRKQAQSLKQDARPGHKYTFSI